MVSGVVASVSWTWVIPPAGALAMEALATASAVCVLAARAGEGTYARASMADAYNHKCVDQNQNQKVATLITSAAEGEDNSAVAAEGEGTYARASMHVTIRVPSNTEIQRLLLTSAVAAEGRTERNSCVCIIRSMFWVSDS